MNFINKDNRPRAVLLGPVGVGHDLLDFLDSREHGRELDELRLGHARDDLGERRFAGAGRPPEDDGAEVVALNLSAQGLAGSY